MWTVKGNHKRICLGLTANGGCFSLLLLPERPSNAGGKSESPRRAEAHSRASHHEGEKKETTDKWSLSLLFQQAVFSLRKTQTPHASGSPSGLRELRGAGWTKHLDWNSSHLIQTLLCCPGCGSSFHFTQLTWAWRTRKELVPFLYMSRVPASCPLFSKHLPASGLPAFYAKPKRDDWNHLADIPWMCLEQKCCKTSGKSLPTRRKAHIYIPELKQAVPCYPNEKFPVFSGLKSSLRTYLQC